MFPDYRIGPEAMKYFELAYEFQMSGDFEQAVYFYKKSLEIEPTAEGYTFLGWTLSFLGKLEAAVAECKKAVELDPDFGNAYNDIGSYLIQLGRLDEAIIWLEKAKRAPRYANPEFPYANLGRLYELKGLWPLSMIEYRKALELNRDYVSARNALEKLQARLN